MSPALGCCSGSAGDVEKLAVLQLDAWYACVLLYAEGTLHVRRGEMLMLNHPFSSGTECKESVGKSLDVAS